MPGQYRYIRNTGGRLMDEPVMVNVTGNMRIYTLCPECLVLQNSVQQIN